MKRVFRSLAIVLVLAGCATTPSVPAGFPAALRWDLVPSWIQWSSPKATVSWPLNDGCAAAPARTTLTAGDLIDRFGAETGTFFSPKGESFASRAVPYVCQQLDYRVYQVLKPIPVKQCKAAPWFGQPGGAAQDQTSEPAADLVAEGKITVVTFVAGGGPGPYPQCAPP